MDYLVLFLCGGSGVDLSLIRPAGTGAGTAAGAGGTAGDQVEIEDISGDGPPTPTKESKSNPNAPENILNAEELGWYNRGRAAFSGEQGAEVREVVVGRLVGRGTGAGGAGAGAGGVQVGGWGEDQVRLTSPPLSSHPPSSS